jgi:spermidine synthase
MKSAIRLSIILAGFTAIASQIIYMRELLIVFYGNELSVSFIFAGWLIAGAVGSGLLGSLADRIKDKAALFSACQIALALLLPLGIVAARSAKAILGINAGQALSISPIIAMSFVILAPICVLMGFMFSIACSIYRSGSNIGGIGETYVLEAIGSMAGGAVTGMVLVRFFPSVEITAFLAMLNMFAAFLLQEKFFRKVAVSALLLAVLVAWPLGAISKLENYSIKRQWQGYELLASKNSIYGNVAVAGRQENYSLFENGLLLYTIPDRMMAEESAHLTLLQHPAPRDILLIGHGAGELTEELLKEPVKKIDYVELDPLIINMTESYLPESYYRALKNSRVSIKNADGRFFVKTTPDKYDCIIVRVGDPYTAQINRYYTVEFFKEAKRILRKGGILSLALTSSESYISAPLGELLSSVYLSLKDVFGTCIVMPGDTAYFVASDDDNYMTCDAAVIERRVNERSLDTRYVREYYLSSKFSPGNVSYLKKVIDNAPDARLNRDLHPTAYRYGLIFWTTLFKGSPLGAILRSINERVVWQAIGLFVILLALSSAFMKRSFKRTALLAVATGGFSSMAFQILLMLAFQMMHGYLFYKLGIILTAFMAGLALGGLFALRAIERLGRERYFLAAVQGDFLLYSLLLPVFFVRGGQDLLFPVMSAIAGFIGGSQFPIAARSVLGKGSDAGGSGGLAYGMDLLGSFFGAVLTGVLLVPVLGIQKTCVALAVINTAVLAVIILNLRVEE